MGKSAKKSEGSQEATTHRRLLHLADFVRRNLMSFVIARCSPQRGPPRCSRLAKEGLDETLSLNDLGLPESLERTLSTTNPIENLNGTLRRVTRNVKRWRDGAMIKCWLMTALLEAERGFRRLRGKRGMPPLVQALERAERIDRVCEGQEAA